MKSLEDECEKQIEIDELKKKEVVDSADEVKEKYQELQKLKSQVEELKMQIASITDVNVDGKNLETKLHSDKKVNEKEQDKHITALNELK